jgi:hypothetical protein
MRPDKKTRKAVAAGDQRCAEGYALSVPTVVAPRSTKDLAAIQRRFWTECIDGNNEVLGLSIRRDRDTRLAELVVKIREPRSHEQLGIPADFANLPVRLTVGKPIVLAV